MHKKYIPSLKNKKGSVLSSLEESQLKSTVKCSLGTLTNEKQKLLPNSPNFLPEITIKRRTNIKGAQINIDKRPNIRVKNPVFRHREENKTQENHKIVNLPRSTFSQNNGKQSNFESSKKKSKLEEQMILDYDPPQPLNKTP